LKRGFEESMSRSRECEYVMYIDFVGGKEYGTIGKGTGARSQSEECWSRRVADVSLFLFGIRILITARLCFDSYIKISFGK